MRKFIGLTKRNLLVFFKDRTMVFFSMLTPIIIFFLYLLFLRGTYLSSLEQHAEQLIDLGLVTSGDLGALANCLLLTGIMGSALITVPYNCLITLVNDRENGVDVDITATPASRLQIILSYFTASALSAIFMTSVILTAGLIVLQFLHPTYVTAGNILLLFGAMILGAISSTAIFMTFLLFIKSSAASGAFMGILSAASGFLIGAYIPISDFTTEIETICNLLPATGITILIRRFLLTDLLNHVNNGIGGLDQGQFVSGIKESFTLENSLFQKVLPLNQAFLYVIMVTVAFLIAIAIIYPKTYKHK